MYQFLLLHVQITGLYNPSQVESIASAVQAMCVPYGLARILLLLGPPGTGKTHTIAGVIREGFTVSSVFFLISVCV